MDYDYDELELLRSDYMKGVMDYSEAFNYGIAMGYSEATVRLYLMKNDA